MRRGQANKGVLCLKPWTDPEDQAHKDRARKRAPRQAPQIRWTYLTRHFCRGEMRELEQTALNLYIPTVAIGVATCADFAMPFVLLTVRPLVDGKQNPPK